MAAPASPTYWIDNDDSKIVADKSFHSGIAVDHIRGNLICAAENSFFDCSAHTIEQTAFTSKTHIVAGDGNYSVSSLIPPIFIPFRYKNGSTELRSIKVEIEGYVSLGTMALKCYTDVRVFWTPKSVWDAGASAWIQNFDSTDGVIGVPATHRGDFSFSSASWVSASDTFLPSTGGLTSKPNAWNGMMGEGLVWIENVSAASECRIRSLRIAEAE